MHSSENRFKNFLNPKDGDNAEFKAYILFLQGLKALDGRDFTTVGKVAKELTKLKVPGNEGKLLEALLMHGGQTVTKDDLSRALWGTTEFIDENALQVNLTRLKKTMAALGMRQQLVSVRGVGYRLEV